jgi:hypothetical protein
MIMETDNLYKNKHSALSFFSTTLICGLYYKPIMTVNDDSWVINKLEASLTDDARVIIYNCHMFIVQATEHLKTTLLKL